MPLVAHNNLPTFDRLRQSGQTVLTDEAAKHQEIRELHIGLLNMMPDAALSATERQFFRLVGESNPVAQLYMHPFTLPELERDDEAQQHIDRYYESVEEIQSAGLDALIITGANVVGPALSNQPFWEPLIKVVDWAYENVTSTLCSCLATHAVLEFRYQQQRVPRDKKTWGVFPHHVTNIRHPLTTDINTRFDVPHSRWNDISLAQFEAAGLQVLAISNVGVHLATSEDGLRFVLFQGHQEYDTVSLLKEYKRDLGLYQAGEIKDPPPYPENYLNEQAKAILNEYQQQLSGGSATSMDEFPEALVIPHLNNTWHDTAEAVVGNWIGCVYQVTNMDRRKPFMDSVDPQNPLGLKNG